MPKAHPIKTELFSFVTFRGAEPITYAEKNARFITHPNLEESNAMACPLPEPPNDFSAYLNTFPKFGDISLPVDVDVLIEFSNKALKKKIPVSKIKGEYGSGPLLTDAHIEGLFEILIFEFLSKHSTPIRELICNLLIVHHAISNDIQLGELGIEKLTDIKIELPYQAIECYKNWHYRECGGELAGVQSLGIADLRMVEQEVCCYLPGEVSHIENVMAKEYKEKSTRNLTRSENTFETSFETEIENMSDVSTTTRNELSSEIAQELNRENSNNFGGSMGVSATWAKTTLDVNAYADFSNSNSSSFSNSEARTFAEEVTSKALQRIVQKSSVKRTSKMIREFEENNKHGFDNRNGEKHVTGIYRWIDILYKNRLVNYGKHLMVEFMIPEPAEFYKRVLKYKSHDESSTTDGREEPKTLSDFGINSPSDIDETNGNLAASYYGVMMNQLENQNITVQKSLQVFAPISHNRKENSRNLEPLEIPSNYKLTKLVGAYSYEYRATKPPSQAAYCNLSFGSHKVLSGNNNTTGLNKVTKSITIDINTPSNNTGTLPAIIEYSGCYSFNGTVTAYLELKASAIDEWKTEQYNKLLFAYNKMLENHQIESNSEFFDEEEKAATNPALNRITEQRELKRICIEMLMKPFCLRQGRKYYKDDNDCENLEIPQINQTKQFTEYAKTVKFFEQAIDWQYISYLFYPYYWADKCDWAELLKNEHDDPVFAAFLQSGMAKVVVPVRHAFTTSFTFYLETGEIWTANNLVAGTEDDAYLSIMEELQTLEGAIESEWETRVPTSLAIIQGKSAFLDQEGLPCCDDAENEEFTSTILPSENILELLPPTP